MVVGRSRGENRRLLARHQSRVGSCDRVQSHCTQLCMPGERFSSHLRGSVSARVLAAFGNTGPSRRGLPAGSRHFSSSGICRACASMRKAAYTSSSSSRECAEKSHRLTASAMASSLTEWMLGSVLLQLANFGEWHTESKRRALELPVIDLVQCGLWLTNAGH